MAIIIKACIAIFVMLFIDLDFKTEWINNDYWIIINFANDFVSHDNCY